MFDAQGSNARKKYIYNIVKICYNCSYNCSFRFSYTVQLLRFVFENFRFSSALLQATRGQSPPVDMHGWGPHPWLGSLLVDPVIRLMDKNPRVGWANNNVDPGNLKLTNLHIFSPTLKNYIVTTTYNKSSNIA